MTTVDMTAITVVNTETNDAAEVEIVATENPVTVQNDIVIVIIGAAKETVAESVAETVNTMMIKNTDTQSQDTDQEVEVDTDQEVEVNTDQEVDEVSYMHCVLVQLYFCCTMFECILNILHGVTQAYV